MLVASWEVAQSSVPDSHKDGSSDTAYTSEGHDRLVLDCVNTVLTDLLDAKARTPTPRAPAPILPSSQPHIPHPHIPAAPDPWRRQIVLPPPSLPLPRLGLSPPEVRGVQ